MKIMILTLINCLLFTGCSRQRSENIRVPRPQILSPEVHADNTVTFRYNAPHAKTVKIDPQFMEGTADIVKDDNGIWSVTLGPVEPDIYPYGFIVDGTTVMDDNNPFYFENERFKASIVNIPGPDLLIHSVRDVPHGTVHYEYYTSPVLGTTGRFLVYTPEL